MVKDLPEDLWSNILRKVAVQSCIDLASLSATGPALRGVVNAHQNSLYECMNIRPLLNFSKWSDAHIDFIQKCIDHGNSDAQFWFGLVSFGTPTIFPIFIACVLLLIPSLIFQWCYRVQGDWKRAKNYLGLAKAKNHEMALFAWTILSVIYSEDLEEDDWNKIKELYSKFPDPRIPQSLLHAIICHVPVLSVDVDECGILWLLTSCDDPTHNVWSGEDNDCVQCMCDRDARIFLGFMNAS